jgi:hypothetical protein
MKQLNEFMTSGCAAANVLLDIERTTLAHGGRLALFGGAARDILLDGAEARPRDLDVVVSGVDPKIILSHPIRENAFGGLYDVRDGVPVDLWELKKTWGFQPKQLNIPDPTFRDLLKTTFFNAEQIVFELGPHPKFHEEFGLAYSGQPRYDRTLELNYEKTKHPVLQVVRAASFCKRFGMVPGPKLQAWLSAHRYPLVKLRVVELNYYGEQSLSDNDLVPYAENR